MSCVGNPSTCAVIYQAKQCGRNRVVEAAF